MDPGQFQGVAGRTLEESTPWWPPLPAAPQGAPNVVLVLLDDVGYAQFGCYGSDIATPTFDRLAAGGLRYSNFHTTALCSPTARVPADRTQPPRQRHGAHRRVLLRVPRLRRDDAEVQRHGVGDPRAQRLRHLRRRKVAPDPSGGHGDGRVRERWPLGRGFERFYGFLAGETDQYHPDLVHDNHQVDPPRSPAEGYHLTEDLADRAIGYLKDLRAVSPNRPFFLYLAPGACHAPHQVPLSHRDRYRGRFDHGWDRWREEVFARQQASGLLPPGTPSQRAAGVDTAMGCAGRR